MDEDFSIISSNTRQEKIKNFFINNKFKLISLISTIILILICYFSYEEIKKRKQIMVSNEFNSILIEFDKSNKDVTTNKLIDLVNEKDPTYSPLSLYFIIDNKLINDIKKINVLFDVLIEETSLEKEIKNLVIYKKSLLNADTYDEGKMLNVLNPLINSNSVWKSHALYLMAEFFYNKGEKEKAKEFFNQIINLKEPNPDIKIQAQKRLNRDLSE